MPQFLPFARELHVHLADSQTNLTAEALPQIPNVWMLKSLFCSWDASVNIILLHPSIHPCCCSWSFSSFSSDPDQVYFNLMSYINLVFNFSFLPSLIDTLTVLAVLKHYPLSSFPLFLPITPCQFPVPPPPVDVYTCKSETVFLKPLFPWLFSTTASFT